MSSPAWLDSPALDWRSACPLYVVEVWVWHLQNFEKMIWLVVYPPVQARMGCHSLKEYVCVTVCEGRGGVLEAEYLLDGRCLSTGLCWHCPEPSESSRRPAATVGWIRMRRAGQ